MAEKEVALKVSADTGNSAKSIKTLKEEYKLAQRELDGLTVGTKEYVAQLEKLGAIKDNIGDLNAEIAAFNPEGKVAAFGNVVSGLASGFSAAQGAMALFGAEGEDLQKTLVKVQAGMAFAEGIKGLAGLKDGFVVLGNVLKANPILLIASIIAGIGTALFALKDKIKVVSDAFEFMGDVLDTVVNATKDFLDYIGLTNFKLNEQRDIVLKNNEAIKKSVEGRYDAEIRAAKRAGEATEGLEIQKLKAITEANESSIRTLKAKGKQRTEDEEKTLNDLLAANRGYYQDILDLADASADKERERQAKAYQDYLAHIEKYGRGGEVGQMMQTIQVGIKEQTIENEIRTIDTVAMLNDAARAEEERKEQEHQKNMQAFKAESFNLAKMSLEATMALTDLAFDHQLRQAQDNAKKEREIKKKQFQVNKAFSVAQIVLNTIMGITQAISSSPPPLSWVLAGINSAMGTAATVKALMTKFDDGGASGGMGGISMGGNIGAAGNGASISPPSTNSTLLNADGSIKKQQGMSQPTVKAIVTETDITSTQKRVNAIEETSKIK